MLGYSCIQGVTEFCEYNYFFAVFVWISLKFNTYLGHHWKICMLTNYCSIYLQTRCAFKQYIFFSFMGSWQLIGEVVVQLNKQNTHHIVTQIGRVHDYCCGPLMSQMISKSSVLLQCFHCIVVVFALYCCSLMLSCMISGFWVLLQCWCCIVVVQCWHG